jgi:hypothetical protein
MKICENEIILRKYKNKNWEGVYLKKVIFVAEDTLMHM